MKCTNTDIPSYLHWDNRKIYSDKDYFYFHKLYRLKTKGNPIQIPEQWVNAISCKWSKFVKKEHILLQDGQKIGDEYDFVYIKELINYQRKSVLLDQNQYTGVHVLTCAIKHTPLVCDYSHSEILIRHRVFKEGEIVPFFDETYSYDSWLNKTAMLKKMKSKFFKELKSDFRIDMIKLISRNSKQNTLFFDIAAFCKFINWNSVQN